MTPSEPVKYTPPPLGRLRPKPTPLGRREQIRDAQDAGNWQRVASLLHEAHTHQEWHGCGLSSWTEYVETLPMSRMHDWRLRRAATLGLLEVCYTLREAMRRADTQTRTDPTV